MHIRLNLAAAARGGDELLRHARIADALGSPFIAAVLEAGQRQLAHAPRTLALIEDWPGDPAAAALAMRFNGALHALARRGDQPALAALYRREHDDFDGAIAAALGAEDLFVAEWMLSPPQTNEVGRAAAFAAALMVARDTFAMPFELLELGSSSGLNLNLARYAYDLGGLLAGTPDSPVRIAPEWRGPSPVIAPLEVVAARGVDLNPLDAAEDATRERLLSFIWADQPSRARRLEHALDIARAFPPRVDRGDAVPWLTARLANAQASNTCRVVMHSMVMQYLDRGEQRAIARLIDAAADQATSKTPLIHVAFEWTPTRSEVRLMLTAWPTGDTHHLATCHPYGDWIEWHGLAASLRECAAAKSDARK